ncbi:MAG: amidophosphoribosyltransferase [Lachnospiraceae bacterium]|nr:amidophosphoribosyltransferase [Lachnospiraceae bacterium]
MDDKIREECGVFGIWDSTREDVAQDIYYGLLSLQHRGQEAAGIAVCSSTGPRGNLILRKDQGLVSEVFSEKDLSGMKGNIGIGHVRYSTAGDSTAVNAQPFTCYYQKGTLGIVHNGNLVNAEDLRSMLMNHGYSFQATSDTEVIQQLLARMRSESRSIEEAVKRTVSYLEGGYALLIMSPRKLVAVRDPLGLKPLCIGKTKTGWILASESCALNAAGAEFIRDVRPGEIIKISKKGLESDVSRCSEARAHCVFEYIYFARLDSRMDEVSVYRARFRGGQLLADAFPVEADLVTGVPESGLTAAAGYADRAGIPYVQAFYKNSYIGRTFIKPTQKERESAVHMKLSVLEDAVRDKRVVLLDDSIVRGTTIAHLIRMMKEAGAKEVHVRISSPPFLHPCYYGTDVPESSQLLAQRMSTEQIREQIGADSLGYMRLEDLDETVDHIPLCKACFDGIYPTEVPEEKPAEKEN